MREIPVDGLHAPAQSRADAVPILRHSMRETAANEVGAMGELVTFRYLELIGVQYRDDSTYDHDLVTHAGTVDVKTKERTVVPLPHYDCTVADYNEDWQHPDWYLFVSLLSDKGRTGTDRFSRAWVLGSIHSTRFDQLARRLTPDMTDGDNGWTPTIPCRNVRIDQLNRPHQ